MTKKKIRKPTKSELNNIAGGFLILEGIASILFSQDKQPLSQLGRIVRIGIGGYVANSR